MNTNQELWDGGFEHVVLNISNSIQQIIDILPMNGDRELIGKIKLDVEWYISKFKPFIESCIWWNHLNSLTMNSKWLVIWK